jgi:hypothetical protein
VSTIAKIGDYCSHSVALSAEQWPDEFAADARQIGCRGLLAQDHKILA